MSRESLKEDFKRRLQSSVAELKPYTLTSDGQWSIKGFIDVFKNVYTVSADTKVVSKIIEIHLLPENSKGRVLWMNYRKIRTRQGRAKAKLITNLRDFLEYRGKDPGLVNPRTRWTARRA